MPLIKAKNSEGQEIEVEITLDLVPKELKDEIIKSATGITYGNVDAKLEALGFTKNQGEKTSDFLERAVKGLQEKVSGLESSKPDITAFQKTIEDLKGELKESKNALKLKDGEVATKLLQKDIESQVRLISKEITVPAYLTEPEEVQAFVSTQEQLILNKLTHGYKAKEVDGKIQFLNGDQIVENADRDVASVKDIVSKDFGFLFKKQEVPGNPGANPGGKPKGGGSNLKFKTYEEAVSHVLKEDASIMAGSAAFYAKLTPILDECGIEH